MATRVYKYGLIPIGYPPKETIDELKRANVLWNNLVALHKKNREDWDDARRAASILYSDKIDELEKKEKDLKAAWKAFKQARMDEGTRDETNNKRLKSERASINRLKAERAEIYKELKPLRKEADKEINKKQLNDSFRAQVNEALSVSNSGVYRATADQIYENFKTAKDKSIKENARLRFHRFDCTGYYHFRCRRRGTKVDGISVDDFMSRNFMANTRCAVQSIDNSKKKPRIRINAVLAGGQSKASKIHQEFDLIYHRPLPIDAQIQNGKILRSRVGDKFKYDLVLTLKIPDKEPVSYNNLKGTIGIDIGFRRSVNSLLIGTVMSSDVTEKVYEIKVPTKIVEAFEYVIDLQSELDDAATDLGRIITPLLKAHPLDEDHKKYKIWRSLALRPAHETLSFEQAYKLSIWLKHEPDTFPEEITKKVHSWWRSYSRKYRELHNRRRNQLTHRKHFYREEATKIVALNKLIVLEEINLNDFAETKEKNTKLSKKARAQRFMASLSEFRDAIKNAAQRDGIGIIYVNAGYTSKTCSECDNLNKALRSEKQWSCPACGVVHDRDENAANNLQKMGQTYLESEKKETSEAVE